MDKEHSKLGEDERAWLVIAAIDVIATAALAGVYMWFVAHAVT